MSLSALEETQVLIETYWNVNIVREFTQGKGILVLIETYWNVNSYPGTAYRVCNPY